MYQIDLKDTIEENFKIYAGMVCTDRALCDVRDGLKPSARQLMFSQYEQGLIHSKPFKKSSASIGDALKNYYIHGDASAYGTLVRLAKPFVMRYVLEDFKGSYGTITQNGSEAAYRYTEMRLSELSSYLFDSLDKDTIEKWFDNFDETRKYPSVLPSLGFYNIVNGTTGIGVALASSIPQFNLREVNTSLIKLLNNPDSTFEELYCAPDFATGGFLINEAQIKESLKTGNGKSCYLRAAIEYDESDNSLIVTEMPYGVYTNTVTAQMAELLNSGQLTGVDSFIDLTKKDPHIKIKLTKNANPSSVIRLLYKKTSLQNYFGINMVMLENGKVPKVFGWKEALSSHLAHSKIVLRNSLKYDLAKYNARLHIIEGLLIALAHIEEIIQLIKGSPDGAAAKRALINRFNFSEIQAKAILDIKLSRLANLEGIKIENEKKELLLKIEEVTHILGTESLFNHIIEDKLNEVSKKFGDDRRTQIIDIAINEDGEDNAPLEKKNLIIHLTNKGNLYANESITLSTQKRGGKGAKVKLQNEVIIDSITGKNSDNTLFFSNKGKVYYTLLNNIVLNTLVSPRTLFNLEPDEKITNIIPSQKLSKSGYIIFITKNGLVKKSPMENYNLKKTKGTAAIKLKEGDSVVSILFVKDEPIGILASTGHFIIIETKDITAIGRLTSGVLGIKLNENAQVIDSKVIPSTSKELISVSKEGLIKKTSIDEFSTCGRNTKGNLIQKLKEGDSVAAFDTLASEKEIVIVSNLSLIRIDLNEIQTSSRHTMGTQSKKLNPNEYITSILKMEI